MLGCGLLTVFSFLALAACQDGNLAPGAGLSGGHAGEAASRCEAAADVGPVWWRDGLKGARFGCATAHNMALQDAGVAAVAPPGADSTAAVSGVLRYRTGRVIELREPSLTAGDPEAN